MPEKRNPKISEPIISTDPVIYVKRMEYMSKILFLGMHCCCFKPYKEEFMANLNSHPKSIKIENGKKMFNPYVPRDV